ncbi:MAG: hypothetical protein M4D80_39460 [Myxococcota bacterium]|nr:hypothetical protein [Myxococcota bacterium]
MRRLIAAASVLVSACGGDSAGTIQLVLSLPPQGDLRPTGMATVAVGITQEDGNENVTTTPLDGMRFEAGDVPLDEPIQLRVELRDNTNRLIAFGRVEQTVTPDRSTQKITIPVRKPIIYVSSDRSIVTLDPTLDGFDPKFQGTITGTMGALAFPIDGTDIGVVTGGALQRIATADHKPVGDVMNLQVTGASDAARVPGERRMVFATGGGLVVANIDTNEVRAIAMTPKPDRVAIGGIAPNFTVYALVGRVGAPTGTLPCMGASMVLAYSLDNPNDMPMVVANGQFSDIEASADAVYASNPCTGKVLRVDGGAPALSMNVPGAGALAIEGSRLWAAGSAPPTSTQGARVRIASVRLDGSDAQEVLLAPKAEVMTYDFDDAKELSLNIHADTLVPLDLAVLPGAQYIAVITRMDSHRAARFDTFSASKVIPEMNALVHDIVLADPQSGAISQRIRAKCFLQLIAKANAEFPDWSCITTSGAETPIGGESVPTTVGALYGGR